MQYAIEYSPSSREVLAGFVLPGGISLTHAFSTIFQGLLASGCGLAASNAWFFLARSTSPAAWFEPGKLAINWRKHSTLSQEIGVSERRLNQIIHELTAHGALMRLTPENGYRGYVPGAADGQGLERSYGLCFGPAIRNYAAFADAVAAAEQRQTEIALIREDLRAAKGELRDRLRMLTALDATSALIEEAGQLLASLPSTGCRNRNVDGMPEDTAMVREMIDRIDAAIDGGSGSEISPSEQKESDHACAENFRCQYNTTPENLDNVHVNNAESLTSAQRTGADSSPAAGSTETDSPPALLTVNLSEETLVDLLTDDLRALFEAQPPELPWTDRLQTACDAAAHRLGVHPSVWESAIRIFGGLVACICLAIIDRNRFHPVTPTRNPGGLLRSMIRQAQSGGSLNLDASIWAIWEREKQGQQPKAGPWSMVRSSPVAVASRDRDNEADTSRPPPPESPTPPHPKAVAWWETLPSDQRDAAFDEFAVTGSGDDVIVRNQREIIEAAAWFWGGIPYPRAKRSHGKAKGNRVAFPASGGLEYATEKTWYRICRQETNRDNEQVANRFRRWAEKNNIPLDHVDIVATFRRFCKRLGDV